MRTKLPRIRDVRAKPPSTLVVTWTDGGTVQIDLSGWLADLCPLMASLKRPEIFAKAAVGEYGADVTWDGDKGDLAIDAVHLERLAEEQRR